MNMQKEKSKIQRIGGLLHRITPIFDSAGNVIDYIAKPLKIELRAWDIMQILIGAAIITIPLSFTEEAWNLSRELPLSNILILSAISTIFMASFVYNNFYRGEISGHWRHFIARLIVIFVFSHLVVGLILYLLQRAPFGSDFDLAFRRTLLIGFPAQMTASFSDSIK